MARHMRKVLKQQEALRLSKVQAEVIESKQRPLQASGNVPSQWGKVVQNESRLIDNGHYMKSSKQQREDYDLGVTVKLKQKIKKLTKKTNKLILVKRINGIAVEKITKEW